MAKAKTVFVCQQCGAESPKWVGQCPDCRAWNSLIEEVKAVQPRTGFGGRVRSTGNVAKVIHLTDIDTKKASFARISTGSAELDRVLGGGVVPGSVVLVAGEPGIGKSTLLTQLAMHVAQQVLYVCGEESVEQVGMRVERLASGKKPSDIAFLASTNVDEIVATGGQEKPAVMIVDSIQTLNTSDLTGMAGSVGQIRESCFRLIEFAKQSGIAVFIVGHVTKGGDIAGPKVLEHMVDAVLQLEGERTGMWRILRAQKNRFGATDEVGVFSMIEGGMADVANPSGAFLEEAQAGVPGSAIVAIMEGTRPVLVEVQALVVESQLPVPRRVAQGINVNKLQVLAAVLQKRANLNLGTRDIFVNVAGGLNLKEPAADLGICLAIASSFMGKALPPQAVLVGEVGLLGEIRRVSFLEKRVKEAKKLGYELAITPEKYKSIGDVVKKILAK
jgi:DNA repair protein RadA/Sms